MLINSKGSPPLTNVQDSHFSFFVRKFSNVSKGSPFNVLTFCNKLNFQKAQRVPPFTIFGIVRFLKMTFSVFKFDFLSEPVRYIRSCFFRPSFFWHHATFSQFVLSKPPRLLLEPKRFASIEDCLGFSALCYIFRSFFKKKKHFSTWFHCIIYRP